MATAMTISRYIDCYLIESKAEADKEAHPPWLREFFSHFHRCLQEACIKGWSPGDRNVMPQVVGKALKYLLPSGVDYDKEVGLREFLAVENCEALAKLLNKKTVDFVLKRERCQRRLLIEFKTNIQFNDLSAAMMEMVAVKKFGTPEMKTNLFTGSLHLFPYLTNVDGLRALNESFDPRPLDFIWVLCDRHQKFDIEAIKCFRAKVDSCLIQSDG